MGAAVRTAAQRLTLLIFRVGQYLDARGRRGLLFYARRIADFVYLKGLLGAELPPTAQVGAGLALPRAGRGVLLSTDTVVGENSMVFSRAVIGSGQDTGPTRLGHDLEIGTGACILGGVTVGDHALIGANTVVTSDVPAGATAFGVPLRRDR